MSAEWLVAYARCRCVIAVRAIGYGVAGERDFMRDFPTAQSEASPPHALNIGAL